MCAFERSEKGMKFFMIINSLILAVSSSIDSLGLGITYGIKNTKISFMGIPTPNLFAGGENMHGRYEFVSLETMQKAVDVIIGIVQEP